MALKLRLKNNICEVNKEIMFYILYDFLCVCTIAQLRRFAYVRAWARPENCDVCEAFHVKILISLLLLLSLLNSNRINLFVGFLFFSKKFGRKINNINRLDELAPHIRLDQLDIPKEVRE